MKGHANNFDHLAALPLEPDPKIRCPRIMTHKKLYEKIRLGWGQGHGVNYKTFLPIRRKNSSKNSNQLPAWLPPLQRTAHFFSRGEYQTALLLLWLGVKDLREGYPLWPLSHPHPLKGAPGTEGMNFPWSRGLLQIAFDAGIKHGNEVGSRVPYVATMDLIVTFAINHVIQLAAFSSKPFENSDDEVKWRTLERLELERRYCLELLIPYYVSSSALVPTLMAGQLEVWLECWTLNPNLLSLANYFADHVNRHDDLSIKEAVTYAAEILHISVGDGWLLFYHCCWTQKIDIDPSVRILTSYPVKSGGRALQNAIQRQYFGGTW